MDIIFKVVKKITYRITDWESHSSGAMTADAQSHFYCFLSSAHNGDLQ